MVDTLTSLTGGTVDIYVENKTTLRGAVIASVSGDLTLDTGSFEYSHIKDKDYSSNLGGGVNVGTDSKSVNVPYGFTDKRQTNFATIGEGTITVRDASTGSATGLEGLNRDVSISQYNTKDGGLQGGFTVDTATVNLVVNSVDTVTKTLVAIADGYKDAKETAGVLYNKAGVVIEKTVTWVNVHLFTSDDEGIIPKALQYGSEEYKIVLDSYIDNFIQYGTEDEKAMYTRYKDSIIGIDEKFLILGDQGSWDDEGRIIEGILWHNQRDNGLEQSYGIKGSSMCQMSVLANLFEGAGIEIPGNDIQPENRLLKILVDDAKKPASDAYANQLESYRVIVQKITGNDSNIIINHVDYRQTWDDNSTKEIINSARPVAVGSKTTGSGHVLTLIGYDKTGWIVNDSYGNKNLDYSKSKTDSYGYDGHNGSAVHYNYKQYDIQKNWRGYMKD